MPPQKPTLRFRVASFFEPSSIIAKKTPKKSSQTGVVLLRGPVLRAEAENSCLPSDSLDGGEAKVTGGGMSGSPRRGGDALQRRVAQLRRWSTETPAAERREDTGGEREEE